jgi:hypothetical protein
MKDANILNSLLWHDGVVRSIRIDHKKSISLKLTLDLYQTESASARFKTIMTFFDVSDLAICLDEELGNNKKAGNISNGYIKAANKSKINKFYLYLVDGIITFTFLDFEISS